MTKLFNIFIPNFKQHEDQGRWRTYDLEAHGDTLDELIDSAVYWQTDEDGGEMGEVPADDVKAQSFIIDWYERQALRPFETGRNRVGGAR